MEINKRRQGHLRFTTEPKQSTKGRRQLPGNTIPLTAGSGVEQNINHFQLHLTKVTVLQCCGQTEVSHDGQSLWFIPVFPGITPEALYEKMSPAGMFAQLMKYISEDILLHFWPHISLFKSESNI